MILDEPFSFWPATVVLATVSPFLLLTLVNNFTRESLSIEAGQRLTGDDGVRVLERVCRARLPAEYAGRQWPGVHQQVTGPVGLLKRRDSGCQSSRKADRQCLH